MKDFGIVVACCQADYYIVKACCASIRYFLGNIPICLIVDGDLSVRSLVKTYGVQVINKYNIENDFLKNNSLGLFSKMIPFWESPWQHFLYLDADTIVWGNILKYTKYYQDFDVIISRPCRKGYSVKEVNYFFFDTQRLGEHFPNFRWQNYQNDYFCAGVFFGKRGIFNLDEYKEMLSFMKRYPNVIKMADQGCLNLLLFRAFDEGRIRLKQVREEIFQITIPDYNHEVIAKRFPINNSGAVYQNEDAIIHWCGTKKPDLDNLRVYSEPVNFFRRKFLSDAGYSKALGSGIILKFEDFQRNIYANYNLYHKKLAKVYQKKFASLIKGKLQS